MAKLTIVSETGMFHSACRCTWGGIVEWYGFKPRKHLTPEGPGFVDRSDRTPFIGHYVVFDVTDARLRSSIHRVTAKYNSALYLVTVHDCVSFAADVARNVGLRLPLVNITPYGFLEILAIYNNYEKRG
jgi:hypothetical protein